MSKDKDFDKIQEQLNNAIKALDYIEGIISEQSRLTNADSYLGATIKSANACLSIALDTIKQAKAHAENASSGNSKTKSTDE